MLHSDILHCDTLKCQVRSEKCQVAGCLAHLNARYLADAALGEPENRRFEQPPCAGPCRRPTGMGQARMAEVAGSESDEHVLRVVPSLAVPHGAVRGHRNRVWLTLGTAR